MKIERIRLLAGGTINIGNFENLKVEFQAEALIDEGEDIPNAKAQLRDFVQGAFREAVRQFKPQPKQPAPTGDLEEKMK